ncbi:c-type cytochrome, methanol metabolism-related [Arenibaculum pallidiluteum]|uniref:c-type cytochrome, methanol metabolism-related n=1 Tax=Arenibaculum pallidiluteum TaxID=2812559 RepID=UPI001F2B425A|nr:c-type cytochrome, methanol metabolism-related [Arenibaculum pallidiluteum]
MVRNWTGAALLAAFIAAMAWQVASRPAHAQNQPAEEEALVDKEGLPTYKVEGGKVDRGTYNGYRRYHNSCHVCHGPDGLGSTFAPNLTDSLKRLDYYKFAETVAAGRKSEGASGDRVMPSFGTDANVMSHLDDIYRYLKARSDGALERGRPQRIGS